MNEDHGVSTGGSPCTTLLAALVIALAAVAVYWNSLSVPFVFDADSAIINNPTIRQLWTSWSPPQNGGPATGRPLANFSFGVNYALGGLNVAGYHILSLGIHILAGLTLFGLVRRTLLLPSVPRRFGDAALPLALVVTLLWTLHPLQTSAVTYVAQRSESLMGLFYLLTLYFFVRGTQSSRSTLWHSLAVLACLAGMLSKEVMVSAPLLVLLYDRIFVAGSLRQAWSQRGKLYLLLAATWVVLAYLVIQAQGRTGSAGFSTDVSAWSYLLTQSRAIVHYLGLSIWPYPLIFDYGLSVQARSLAEVLPDAILVTLLFVIALIALWRRPWAGFLGVSFFAILAPSSSVIPISTELMVEHRMYLPLAAVMVLLVLALYRGLGRGSYGLLLPVMMVFALLTIRRNVDYGSAEILWRDTLAKRPNNERAEFNLGNALLAGGQVAEAITHYQKSCALWPREAVAWNNLGIALARNGQVAEAITNYARAIRLEPNNPDQYYDLGNALLQQGRLTEAATNYLHTLQLRPKDPATANVLGYIFGRQGSWAKAIALSRAAVQLEPDNPIYCSNLAWLLATCPVASLRNGEEAVELGLRADGLCDRTNPLVIGRLAAAYAEAGKFPDAIATAQRAMELADPALVGAIQSNLELYRSGRPYYESGATNSP